MPEPVQLQQDRALLSVLADFCEHVVSVTKVGANRGIISRLEFPLFFFFACCRRPDTKQCEAHKLSRDAGGRQKADKRQTLLGQRLTFGRSHDSKMAKKVASFDSQVHNDEGVTRNIGACES